MDPMATLTQQALLLRAQLDRPGHRRTLGNRKRTIEARSDSLRSRNPSGGIAISKVCGFAMGTESDSKRGGVPVPLRMWVG